MRLNLLRRYSLLAALCCVICDGAAYTTEYHVKIAMRDGVRLEANLYRPETGSRWPVLLVRTPYNKGIALFPGYQVFIEHGYAILIEDVRGKYGSEGHFSSLDQEGVDGYDTINWIARQRWSDGNVGMVGGSYLGIAQWKAAVLNNPHLKAIAPAVSGDDDYFDRFYSPGGAYRLGHRLLWFSENLRLPGFAPNFDSYVRHLPLRTADRAATGQTLRDYQETLDHPLYDEFWKRMSVRMKLGRVRVPVFSVGGWYDGFVESDLDAFHELRRLGVPAEIVIGPWPHNASIRFLGVDYGPSARLPLRHLQAEWFDRWLKHVPEKVHSQSEGLRDAPVRIFVMGANQWRYEREWPPREMRETPLYFAGRGNANGLSGDGKLQWKPARRKWIDRFSYDPRQPVPTLGGAVCCNPRVFPWGPVDQRPIEGRRDVLVYTSEILKRPVEVIGTVRVILYASTSAPDTDFTAKLVDVFPNGEARNLTDGILRIRYRHGLDKVVLARRGEVYELTIDAGVTSNRFLEGHQIRVEISSGNFPRFDRNPNTGRPIANEASSEVARQEILHGGQFQSRILLPVVPELTSSSAARYVPKRAFSYRAR